MRDKRKTFFDKTFRKPDGGLAIMQIPNIPLSIWIVATIVGFFVKHGAAHTFIQWVETAALVYWAVWEIWKGVNYFRKALGAVVLLGLIVSVLMRLFK